MLDTSGMGLVCFLRIHPYSINVLMMEALWVMLLINASSSFAKG